MAAPQLLNILLNQQQLEQRVNERLVGFVRYARENRFLVGMAESLDCQRVIACIGISYKSRLKLALKSIMCSNADDWERFDRMFDLYWQHQSGQQQTQTCLGGGGTRTGLTAMRTGQPRNGDNNQFDVPDAQAIDGIGIQDGRLNQAGASAGESLESKNFKHINQAAELRQMEEMAEQLAHKIRHRILRRLRLDQGGKQIDLRRSLRKSLSYGGEVFKLQHRRRRVQMPKLVLMLDVSRSMSVYSYLFLRFARGILMVFKGADAFAFHTRLQHIGEVMREQNRVNLVEKLELISFGWGGGTRIDESLAEFNRRYAHKILNKRTVFIMVSDGYDSGDPDELVKQLTEIKLRTRRLVWVNPLLGQQSYEPKTRSMRAVLPLLDVFAPGHNLESLAALEIPMARL